jgi:sugar (pentulose or hexulose) kinase
LAAPGIITIDIGTTSMRAILFDAEGGQLALAREDNPPAYYADGRVEQAATTWEGILERILSACAGEARERGITVEGIALTSQRSSVIPVDREGAPLRPAIMWQDQRTEAICNRLAPRNAEVYRVCGMRVTTVMSACKMTWLRENEPDLFGRAWKLVGIHDFVLRALTGAFLTDHSLASRTNLLNLEKLDWDEGLMDLFGVPRSMLCDLVKPGSVAGGLEAGLAARVGIRAGTPVITAGGDQQCAALGLGLTGPDRVVANTGTGSYVLGYSARPAFDPDMRAFCNAAAIPGAYVVEAGMSASGVLYRWFNENFYSEAKNSCADGLAAMNEEAASSPAGANGVAFLPRYKLGGDTEKGAAGGAMEKGLFYGLTIATRRGDMVRALLEGIAAEMAENLRLVEALAGKAGSVHASGGLTRFDLFNQIQADLYGLPVRKAGHGEATAVGAWISAAKTLGFYGSYEEAVAASERGSEIQECAPDPANAPIYERLRATRRALRGACGAA